MASIEDVTEIAEAYGATKYLEAVAEAQQAYDAMQARAEAAERRADQLGARLDAAVQVGVDVQAAFDAHMRAAHPTTPPPPPPPPPPVTGQKLLGMSSPRADFPTRLAQVGPEGILGRRIFAWLQAGGDDQMDLVAQAKAAGMMPVISYKVTNPGNPGAYVAMAEQAAAKLAALNIPVRLAIWHEPFEDMTPEEFVALNERLIPIFKRGQIKVGCFINGWLLDRQVDVFDAHTSAKLFDLWDWFGIDTYESGTITSPGAIKPADRIPKLVAYLASKGKSTMPIGIGEYNGYSAATIKAAGDAIIACKQLEFACMWNATTGKGYVLEGERLAAFKATKARPEIRK